MMVTIDKTTHTHTHTRTHKEEQEQENEGKISSTTKAWQSI